MVSTRKLVAAVSVLFIVFLILSLLLPPIFMSGIWRQKPYDEVPDWGSGIIVGDGDEPLLTNITYDDVPFDIPWDLNIATIYAIITPEDPPRYWRQTAYDNYTVSSWTKSNSTLGTLSEVSPGSEIVYTVTHNITHTLAGNLDLLSLWPDPMIIQDSVYCDGFSDPDSYNLSTDVYGTVRLEGRFSGEDNSTLQYQVTYLDLDWQLIRPLALPASLTPSSLTRYQTQGLNLLSQSTRNDIQSRLNLILPAPDNAFEEAFAILDYFKTNFAFDITAPRPSQSDEKVAWFLAQGAGVGLDFATTYTMFLRSRGIAARPVLGFVLGENNGTARILRLMHLHFWVEVYIPTSTSGGYWLQFDPTPLPSLITDGLPPPAPSDPPIPPDEDPYVISTYYNLTLDVPYPPVVDRFVPFQLRATLLKDDVPESGELIEFWDETEQWLLGSNTTSATGETTITFTFDNSAIVGWHFLRAAFHAKSAYNFLALHGPSNLNLSVSPAEVNRTMAIRCNGTLSDPANGRGISYNETGFFGVSITLDGSPWVNASTDAQGAYDVTHPLDPFHDPFGNISVEARFFWPGIFDPPAVSNIEWVNITVLSQLTLAATPNSVRLNTNLTLSGQLRYDNGTGIPGRYIQLFWNGSNIGQTITDSGGNYLYEHNATELGQVTIEAQFSGGSNIYGSRTTAFARVHDQGTIAVFVQDSDGDQIVQRGQMVRFTGWVENSTGHRQGGVMVIISFNGTQVATGITFSNNGSFNIPSQIQPSYPVGLFEVTGNVTGVPLLVVSTIDYLVINSTTQLLNLLVNQTRVRVGETILLTGSLVDDQSVGISSSLLSIDLTYQTTTLPLGTTTTLVDGTFQISLIIPPTIPGTVPTVSIDVIFAGTPYYRTVSESQMLDVFVNADFSIQVPYGPYRPGSPISVNGILEDSFGRPLANREVILYLNGTQNDLGVTNGQGQIDFTLVLPTPPPPLQRVNYTVQLQHETVIDIPSNIEIIAVEASSMQLPILPPQLIILVIGIVSIVIVAFLLYRYLKRRPRKSKIPSVDAATMLTTLRQLLTDKKYRESIIYAFRMFEVLLQSKFGLFRDPSVTVREFANQAIAQARLDTRNMEIFVRGVEEARFSEHAISYKKTLTTLNAFAKIYNQFTGGKLRFVTQEEQPAQE